MQIWTFDPCRSTERHGFFGHAKETTSKHYRIAQSDIGVLATDLFIYNLLQPGTGGPVSKLKPDALLPRYATIVDMADLKITFLPEPDDNTAKVTLTHKGAPEAADGQVFHLTKEFRTESEVALTILFEQWKIVAVIDGELLLIRHKGWVGVHVEEFGRLRPEYQKVPEKIANEPEKVRTMWRYALVLLMVHDEHARFVESTLKGDSLHLVVQMTNGDRFAVVRPDISEEHEQLLLEQIREIVEHESAV